MATAFQADKRIVILKAEVTPGTFILPTATDNDCLLEDAKYDPKIEFDNSKKILTPDHANFEDVPGAQAIDFSISGKLRCGSGVATAPKMEKLFLMAGMVKAVVGSTGITYTDGGAGDFQTYSALVIDITGGASPVAVQHAFRGISADGEIGASGVGKPIMVGLKCQGIPVSASSLDLSNAFLSTVSAMTAPDTTSAVIFTNATTKIANTAFKISSFKLAFGNKIQPEINPGNTDATGYDYFGISERNPKLTINPMKTTKAIYDAIASAVSASPLGGVDVEIAFGGSTFPWTISMPNCQQLNPKEAMSEGRVRWNLDFNLMRNGAATALVANIPIEARYQICQGVNH
jgi:hypothetical protein